MAIVMAEKKDTDLTSGYYRPNSVVESESIVSTERVTLTDLTTTEKELEKQSLSPD